MEFNEVKISNIINNGLNIKLKIKHQYMTIIRNLRNYSSRW